MNLNCKLLLSKVKDDCVFVCVGVCTCIQMPVEARRKCCSSRAGIICSCGPSTWLQGSKLESFVTPHRLLTAEPSFWSLPLYSLK